MDAEPQQLYTATILATYAGSTGAVLVVYNTFRRLLNRDNLWVAFAISLIVSLVVALATGALADLMSYLLVFLNACLLFASATGGQELIGSPNPNRKQKDPRSFTSSWMGE